MTMQQINTLKWEPLREYYDDSIKAITDMRQAKQELSEANRELEVNSNRLKYTTVGIYAMKDGAIYALIIAMIAMIIMAAAWFLIRVFYDDSNTYIEICALIILAVYVLSFVVFFIVLYRSESMHQEVEETWREISKDVANAQREVRITESRIRNIECSDAYKNMLLVFEENQDIAYIKELRKIIVAQRATTHPGAVTVYEADQKYSDQLELKKRSIAAQEQQARNLGHLSHNIGDLSQSLDHLSEKVDALNAACKSGTATGSDATSVNNAAESCLSVVSNVVSIMSALAGMGL